MSKFRTSLYKKKKGKCTIRARDSIDLLFDVKDRKIDQSIVFRKNIGWERRTFRTWHRNDSFSERTSLLRYIYKLTRAKTTQLVDNRYKRRCKVLTGNKRSISTLHLWQKNRDIGLPSTTASAMFNVSLTFSSYQYSYCRNYGWIGPTRLGSTRLDSTRFDSIRLGLIRGTFHLSCVRISIHWLSSVSLTNQRCAPLDAILASKRKFFFTLIGSLNALKQK